MSNAREAARRRLAGSRLAGALGLGLRLRLVLRHAVQVGATSLRWLATSRETTNFNYDLTPINRLHLAWWVAEASNVPVREVLEYFDELDTDTELRAHLRDRTSRSPYRRIADLDVRFGRRLAWYAIVRALRPRHVVETGIDKGLGTCVLAAAVRRNGAGRVTAIDVSPAAGWLVAGAYAECVDISVGDAASVIAGLTEPVDLLVHDVHSSSSQEQAEYDALLSLLGSAPMILNDNAHSHDVLPKLAARFGWHLTVFREVPAGHWYPGAAMALAWPTRAVPAITNLDLQ